MRINKMFVLIVCALLIMSMFTACSSKQEAAKEENKPEEKVYVWKAGHNLSTEHPYHLGLVKFGELMAEKSKGRIKLEVFPSTQLGNERDVIEALQMGTVDITLVSTAPLSGFSDDFLVFDLPYIFKDRPNAYKVLDGPIGQGILATLEKNKLIGLTFMENGFYNMTSSKKIVRPSDMKGVKIRSLENPLQVDTYNFIGANAIPMAFGEVFTALQNKTLDATALTYSVIGSQKIYTVQPYICDTWHFYAPASLLMSKVTWDGIPDDLKAIVKESAKEATDYQRKMSAEVDDKMYKIMKDYGIVFSTVDRQEWADAMIPKVYEKYVPSKISADLVKAIQDAQK